RRRHRPAGARTGPPKGPPGPGRRRRSGHCGRPRRWRRRASQAGLAYLYKSTVGCMQIQLRKLPMPDTDLTPRQTQILRLIQRAVQETGMPPTRKEIADELGFRSPNAAEEHLRALERKGVITLIPGSSRGIQLKD